jgi:hypothetical protein
MSVVCEPNDNHMNSVSLMIRRLKLLAAIVFVVTAASGCAESTRETASGKGQIRGINSIVTAPDVAFLIEERALASLSFKENSGFNSYDDLSYNFNFDVLLPGDLERTRLATQFIDVVLDTEYTVVLTGTVANPSTIYWEDPVREWSDTETVSEVFFAHLAPSIGELDVYFAAPGTAPVLGQAVGSLTNGTRLPGMDFEQAEYEVILTPKDDPATIIYQSVPLGAGARTRPVIAIFDPDPSVPGNVAVNSIGAGSSSVVHADVNSPPQVRTLHAAFGTANYDGYFDSDFGNVVFPDVGFQELAPYADVTSGSTLFTTTPVGNSGAVIHEEEISIAAHTRHTFVLAGEPGDLLFADLFDDARPLETAPVIRFLNVSVNTEALDIYIEEPGTSLEDVILPEFRGLPSLLSTGFVNAPPGVQEITVTLFADKTPITTPVILDLANLDVVDIAIVDTVDPALVEVLIFDRQ